MRPLSLILFAGALATVACSDNNGPTAAVANAEHPDSVWALIGTPVSTPSGYSVEGSRSVRTDLSIDFDFAYNIESDGSHVFLPRAALGIDTANSVKPGFRRMTETFEGITLAPGSGYTTDDPVVLAIGERYVVRGRVTCAGLGLPKYAKIEIVEFDDAARTVTFRILANDNCGFRSLEPGLPER
jgi:hypothetical protein